MAGSWVWGSEIWEYTLLLTHPALPVGAREAALAGFERSCLHCLGRLHASLGQQVSQRTEQ